MFTTNNRTSKIVIRLLGLGLLCGYIASCSDPDPGDGDAITKEPEPIDVVLPTNFPKPVYDLATNPVTKEGFALGKALFYDARLSRNNTISCGFCHMQPNAFTHHGHDVSHGIDDKLGRRNALPIQNLLFYKTFFWDGGVHNLDLVGLNAISDEVEMDETVDNILEKLESDPEYRAMFEAAYGSPEITSTKFLQSLSQFLATLISSNSKYDLHVRKERGITLTETELKGLGLFKQNCAGCHATDLFTDQTYRNNGFSTQADLERDQGREEITLNPEDRGKFKVPSLRNVEYSAPYMHNGKLQTLEAVLNFYSGGINESATLDPLLKRDGTAGFDFTNDEKNAIIAFLKTLTDEQFLTDIRFSEY